MATEGERYRQLCAFLEDSFSLTGLKQFLVFNDYKAVSRAVDAHAGQTDYSFQSVEELDQQSLIDERFFDCLSKQLPAKRAQIQSIAKLWLSDRARTVEPEPVSTGVQPERPHLPVEVSPPLPGEAARISEPPAEFENSIGMKLKWIPAGEFQMGSTESYDEKPRHLVTISRPFYLGVYPLTQSEYMQVMKKDPSQFSGRERLPVEFVSWFDAVAFCNGLSQKEDLPPFYAIQG
jgi:formylglycine-generating enzyme required for sulfatase activity